MSPVLANVIQDAFSPLISVFKTIMVFLHGNVAGGSWGLAIIGLTLVVRAALVPLTVKQFSSMSKMQALGPEIKALRERHKDDKQRLNEETMKFYRENQVNPAGSCLPIVFQFPVFISLYYMLRSDLKLQICGQALKSHHVITTTMIEKTGCQMVAPGSGKFLFIPDITASAKGGVLAILIVLYIGSQLVSSLLTTATVDRNQRLLMLGLPFVFTFFIIRFPAGLILYWITTNIWTVGQQFVVRRYFPPANLAGAGVEGGKSPLSPLSRLWSRNGEDGGIGKPSVTAAAIQDAGNGRGAAKAKGAAGPGAATATGGVAKKDAVAKKGATTKTAPTATATARRTAGGTGATANGRGVEEKGAGRAAKPSPQRGSSPPLPPRKKKKRSGRRR